MPRYCIWMEGYAATGEHGEATYHGDYAGEDFRSAVERMMHDQQWDFKLYDRQRLTYWGCKFYDNEADARQSFG
jgi:hypothetical protein